jgi:hypothetical protein
MAPPESRRRLSRTPAVLRGAGGRIAPLDQLERKITTARAAFEQNWKACAASEKQRVQKEAPGKGPEIEKKAET